MMKPEHEAALRSAVETINRVFSEITEDADGRLTLNPYVIPAGFGVVAKSDGRFFTPTPPKVCVTVQPRSITISSPRDR